MKTGLNLIDFRKDPDQIQEAVNAWVSEHTSGAIEELTVPDLENPLNRLLACSAVYFQSMWVAPFEKEQTKTSEFRVSKHKVDAYLPRFKIGFEADIAQSLQNMGVDIAFDGNRADFSGIDGKKQWLYLGPIIHKACVDVDEIGTVAAASTADMFKTIGMVGFGVFKADHPFLFLIRHNGTGSILFNGRVTDPSA